MMNILSYEVSTKRGQGQSELGYPYRTFSGLAEMQARWPGEVILVASSTARLAPKETVWVTAANTPFSVEITEDASATLQGMKPNVTTGLHMPDAQAWLSSSSPLVLTSEFNLNIRMAQHGVTASSTLGRARAALGQARVERSMRKLAKLAKGLQCNGPLADKSYGRLSPNSMLFHDHRILARDLELARSRKQDSNGPLRIAFSGRITAIKGLAYVIEMARILDERGVEVEISMLGDGDLRDELEGRAGRNVDFRGFVPFVPDWKSFMRDHVDLLIAPHPQGDPSCTYFESLGSGVPVLGFPNPTWRTLIKQYGFGWMTNRMTASDLAMRVEWIAANRFELETKRALALDFMSTRSFEATTQRRADHILSVVA